MPCVLVNHIFTYTLVNSKYNETRPTRKSHNAKLMTIYMPMEECKNVACKQGNLNFQYYHTAEACYNDSCIFKLMYAFLDISLVPTF